MLLGQNVNSYGKNLEHPITFAQLLKEIEKIEGLKRIRFMTSHPKDQVPEEVVKDRFDRLLAQVQEIARERSSRFEGTVQEVLVESVNDQDASLVTGRMGNNLLVHFPGDASMIGTFKQIHLDVCKGFYYMGTPAE